MAESFAFVIAGKALGKLGNATFEEICLAWGVKDEFQKLTDKLSAIKAVLIDAEEQKARNQELTFWIEKFKDACYEVEDLVDEFEIEALRRQVLQKQSSRRKVRHFFSSSNPLAFRLKMAHKIKRVKEMLDSIVVDKAKFNLVVKPETRSVTHRESYSFVNRSNIIGRREDKQKIMTNFLMHPAKDEDIPVLPIVGIGGLGKTVLAQLLYMDEKVKTHFELKLWICVSEDFDIRNLMIKIIESATGYKCSDMNKEGLHTVLHECLNDKKYLLILDDVWNDDNKKWTEFKDLLSVGAKGSKIIVTTRSKQVATITGTIPQHDLQKLSDEDSLSLFLQFAFRGEEDKQHPNLVKIGEEIVRKCKGVALAVKTLGSLLCSTKAEHEWESVRDNEIWKLEQKENDILPALKLSYDQLPLHLRRCFAYCSVFPKDHYFADYILISFWMAHGLLQSSDKDEEPEDIGKRYINELCSRSFFQEVDDRFWCVSFKMHDLLHDLALLVAKNEVNSFDHNLSPTVRHLRADNLLKEEASSEIQSKLGRVRTFCFSFGVNHQSDSLIETCSSMSKQLRALDFTWGSFEELPTSVCNLKHLRYLSISDNANMKKLPNSICSLQSLQTLLLWGCRGVEELPSNIRYMISLRTLSVTTKQSVLQKNGIGCLTSLRFLSFYQCENLKYLFDDMQNLKALRTLVIWHCNNLVSLPESLICLTALETLLIVNCEKLDLSMVPMGFGGKGNEKEDGSLRTLRIEGLPKLKALPEWILLGSTKTIRRLLIRELENLSTLPAWLQHLISLQNLQIRNCPKLSSLPQGLQQLTSLKELFIKGCPSLSESCKPKTGKDWPKIANVPRLYLPDLKTDC